MALPTVAMRRALATTLSRMRLNVQQTAMVHGKSKIGKREVVGFGMSGEYAYVDRLDFPFPAIRWEEPTSEIEKLREKEKGDWKNLSLEEKKKLYRYSYRQTFSEISAPTGVWKFCFGMLFLAGGTVFWMYAFLKTFVYGPMPISTTPEYKEAQLERMIQLRSNPVTGVASKWDYEKNQWKE